MARSVRLPPPKRARPLGLAGFPTAPLLRQRSTRRSGINRLEKSLCHTLVAGAVTSCATRLLHEQTTTLRALVEHLRGTHEGRRRALEGVRRRDVRVIGLDAPVKVDEDGSRNRTRVIKNKANVARAHVAMRNRREIAYVRARLHRAAKERQHNTRRAPAVHKRHCCARP